MTDISIVLWPVHVTDVYVVGVGAANHGSVFDGFNELVTVDDPIEAVKRVAILACARFHQPLLRAIREGNIPNVGAPHQVSVDEEFYPTLQTILGSDVPVELIKFTATAAPRGAASERARREAARGVNLLRSRGHS